MPSPTRAYLAARVGPPEVVPATELGDIAVQVLGAHLVVDADVAALEQGPERLHAVGVGPRPHILAGRVLHALLVVAQGGQPLIGEPCPDRGHAPAVMGILRRAALNMVRTVQQNFRPEICPLGCCGTRSGITPPCWLRSWPERDFSVALDWTPSPDLGIRPAPSVTLCLPLYGHRSLLLPNHGSSDSALSIGWKTPWCVDRLRNRTDYLTVIDVSGGPDLSRSVLHCSTSGLSPHLPSKSSNP